MESREFISDINIKLILISGVDSIERIIDIGI